MPPQRAQFEWPSLRVSRKEHDLTSSLQPPTLVLAPTGNTFKQQMRVLMLEHGTSDQSPIVRALEKSGMGIHSDRATCVDSFRAALQTFEPDVILTVGAPSHHDIRAALEILREVRPTAPMIAVADGLTGPQTVSMVRAGVADVVLRPDVADLPRVVSRALEARRDVQKLTPRQIEVLQLVAAGLRPGTSQPAWESASKP